MSETFEVKPIHANAVAEALHKAEHYRLLNDPQPAESICQDVLAIDAANQKALVILLLAISDQFADADAKTRTKEARGLLARLTAPYEREYYAGLICERQARAYLGGGMTSMFAYESFREAMDHYEKAEALRPPGNDDPILRYNSCVRTLKAEKLKPRDDEGEFQLE